MSGRLSLVVQISPFGFASNVGSNQHITNHHHFNDGWNPGARPFPPMFIRFLISPIPRMDKKHPHCMVPMECGDSLLNHGFVERGCLVWTGDGVSFNPPDHLFFFSDCWTLHVVIVGNMHPDRPTNERSISLTRGPIPKSNTKLVFSCFSTGEGYRRYRCNYEVMRWMWILTYSISYNYELKYND